MRLPCWQQLVSATLPFIPIQATTVQETKFRAETNALIPKGIHMPSSAPALHNTDSAAVINIIAETIIVKKTEKPCTPNPPAKLAKAIPFPTMPKTLANAQIILLNAVPRTMK